MIINLNLNFACIESIFANEEYKLMTGETIYFSKRKMLTDIYNQVPLDGQNELVKHFPKVFELLDRTNMLKL